LDSATFGFWLSVTRLMEAPSDQVDQAQKILDGVLSSTVFFQPVQ